MKLSRLEWAMRTNIAEADNTIFNSKQTLYDEYCEEYDEVEKTGVEFKQITCVELKKGDVIYNRLMKQWREVVLNKDGNFCFTKKNLHEMWFIKQ